MKTLSTVLEGLSVLDRARQLASERKAAADKAQKESNSPDNEIAYKLLKFDNFDKDEYLSNHSNIDRSKMPQIPENELDTILIHFMNRHGGIRKEVVPITKLQPTQNELDMDKVRDMIKSDHNWRDRKYVVSKEYKLCDGHHSIICGLIGDPDASVTVYRSKLPIEKMIQILNRLKVTNQEK